MWVGSMTLEYVDYIPRALNKVRVPIYYSYIHTNTWTYGHMGGVNTHGTIHRNHCPSQHYSLKIKTLFTIFLLYLVAIFIILIGVSFFLFAKFLLVKVRQWRHVLYAKYRKNKTIQSNNVVRPPTRHRNS